MIWGRKVNVTSMAKQHSVQLWGVEGVEVATRWNLGGGGTKSGRKWLTHDFNGKHSQVHLHLGAASVSTKPPIAVERGKAIQ